MKEVIIDGITYVPKEKSELKLLEEKYKSGSYICIGNRVGSIDKISELEWPKWLVDWKYKLIHKKHKNILDAWLADNNVEIEFFVTETGIPHHWSTVNNFIETYYEKWNYRLKQKSETLYNDWRLPTIRELLAIVDYNKYHPASNLEDTISDFYWSSSPCASDSSGTWVVGFYDGCGYWFDKRTPSLVRCVRDGEKGLEWSASSSMKMTFDEAIKYASNLVAPVYYRG